MHTNLSPNDRPYMFPNFTNVNNFPVLGPYI